MLWQSARGWLVAEAGQPGLEVPRGQVEGPKECCSGAERPQGLSSRVQVL